MSCEYVKEYYGVPACVGRIVVCQGKKGVIAEDRGHYIGVNFDGDKPGLVFNVHPTDKVEYLGVGKVRKMTKSQIRYKRYLEHGDSFDNFKHFLSWDANPEHEWNLN